MKRNLIVLILLLPYLLFSQIKSADVIIYGGNASAVIAAVQVKKMGKSVLIVCPDTHLGGLTSGGLGFTDTGNKEVIGGLARDFYQRVYQHYQKEGWKNPVNKDAFWKNLSRKNVH